MLEKKSIVLTQLIDEEHTRKLTAFSKENIAGILDYLNRVRAPEGAIATEPPFAKSIRQKFVNATMTPSLQLTMVNFVSHYHSLDAGESMIYRERAAFERLKELDKNTMRLLDEYLV